MSMSSSRFHAMPLRRLPLAVLLSFAFAGASQAQSLVDIYEMARGYDATYQAARAQYDANLAKADQGKATLLPTLGFSAGATRSGRMQNPHTVNDLVAKTTESNYSYTTQTAGLNATQPLYRPGNLVTWEQALKQKVQARVQFDNAAQDLIIRVSQAISPVPPFSAERDIGSAATPTAFSTGGKAAVRPPGRSARSQSGW